MSVALGIEQVIASNMQTAKVGLPIALLVFLISLCMTPLAPVSYFVRVVLTGFFFGGCTVLNWWSAGGPSAIIWFMVGIATLTSGGIFFERHVVSLPAFKNYPGWFEIQYGAIVFSVAFSGWLILRRRIERFLGVKSPSLTR